MYLLKIFGDEKEVEGEEWSTRVKTYSTYIFEEHSDAVNKALYSGAPEAEIIELDADVLNELLKGER